MIMIIPIGHDHDYANRSSITSILLLELPLIFAGNEHRDEILTHPIECVGHVVKSVDMGVPKYRCWIWTKWGSTGWKKFTKFISITIHSFIHAATWKKVIVNLILEISSYDEWLQTSSWRLVTDTILTCPSFKPENMKIWKYHIYNWQQGDNNL